MKSAKRVENKRKEGGAQRLNGDVIQENELCDIALVCIAHGKVDIFQGTGVEVSLLD